LDKKPEVMKVFEREISSIRVCPAAMPHNTYGLRVIICYKESYYNVGFLYDGVLREEKLTHPAHVNVENGHYDPSNVVDGRFVKKEGSQYYVTAGYTFTKYRFYNGLTLDFIKARLPAQVLDISEDGSSCSTTFVADSYFKTFLATDSVYKVLIC